MSYGPIFRFLILVFVPVVPIFVYLITGIIAVMAVARPLFRIPNNQHHHQHQQLKRHAGTSQLLKNDRLSELPDDLIICILSFLTMKEAGRTSVLSKRWRCQWAYIPTLWFDSRKLIDEFKMETKSPKVEGPRYLHWVEQVVRSYKAPTIDEFKVQFDISYLQNSSCSIDNFIRFALEKKVKRLEVDLSLYCGGVQPTRHTFNCVSFCNSLTSLVLGCVNITGEMLESFLWNCQALEYLSVHRSDTLLSLKVTGRSRNLKTIRISKCFNIKQFEISAPNLVSVCFFGPKNMNVEFQSTPKLVEVSLGSLYANDLDSCFSDLSGYHSQIEALSLDPMSSLGNVMLSVEDPIFTRLKKLDMTVHPEWDDDLNCFELLLKACPFLHHFKLQKTKELDVLSFEEVGLIEKLIVYEGDVEERDGLRKQEANPHYCLKVVEILGFVGYPVDLEIAAFLIESAVSLEKIVLDPRELCTLGGPWEFEDTPEKIHARDKAKHLRTNLKPGDREMRSYDYKNSQRKSKSPSK